MNEHVEQLQSKLVALRERLDAAEHLDDESRRMLDEVAAEIQSALNDESPDRLASEPFVDRLMTAARDFEAQHPAFSRVLESIVDVLGQMGI
jgi:DnaJ-domain-containing protein 1